MKSREASSNAQRDEEFLEAVRYLHDKTGTLPEMTEIHHRIISERETGILPGLRVLHRAGVNLGLIDITEEIDATRQRLEEDDKLKSAWEARTLALMNDRAPVRLVYLP